MSVEAARGFIEKMKTDGAILSRIMEMRDVTARMTLAMEEGFDFSPADIHAVAGELEVQLRYAASGSCCNGFDGCGSK